MEAILDADNPVCRKFSAATTLTRDDEVAVERLLSNRQSTASGITLIPDGHVGHDAYVLLSGWAYRFKMFADGRRQISRLFLPGDFIGLNASFLGMPEQSIAALTNIEVARFEGATLLNLLQKSPQLSFAFLWSDARDRFILEERVASIGRRSAYERLAHIFMELYLRLQLIGKAAESAFLLPLTQEHLADLLGLTSIHVNRVLHRLKRDGLIAVDARTITLLSRDRLMQIAEFDPRYLMHSPSTSELTSTLVGKLIATLPDRLSFHQNLTPFTGRES